MMTGLRLAPIISSGTGFPETNQEIYWERLSYSKRAFLCESRMQVFVPVIKSGLASSWVTVTP
jgi:hypothetical protein